MIYSHFVILSIFYNVASIYKKWASCGILKTQFSDLKFCMVLPIPKRNGKKFGGHQIFKKSAIWPTLRDEQAKFFWPKQSPSSPKFMLEYPRTSHSWLAQKPSHQAQANFEVWRQATKPKLYINVSRVCKLLTDGAKKAELWQSDP